MGGAPSDGEIGAQHPHLNLFAIIFRLIKRIGHLLKVARIDLAPGNQVVKRNRNGSRRRQTLQVWTYEQARSVIPYVRSIMKSLRDIQIESQNHSLRAERLAKRAGRPDRDRIINQQEALESADEASERFRRTLADLHDLDIYCLDAIRGLALIPFAQNKQLAWYVFDLFDKDPLLHWRFHDDPLETRRSVADLAKPPSGDNYVV